MVACSFGLVYDGESDEDLKIRSGEVFVLDGSIGLLVQLLSSFCVVYEVKGLVLSCKVL